MKFISVIILFIALNNLVLSQEPLSSEEDLNDESWLKRGLLEQFGMCFLQSDCLPTEYCHNKKGVFGRCIRKGKDGDYCMYNYRCLSNHCHRITCKGKPAANNQEKNGRCKTDEECHSEQYCNDKKCRDRQLSGSCSSDSQCMSNHCSLFRCKN